MSAKFQAVLRSIGKACEESSFTEAEVEKLFQERGFFSELGYEGIGKDILAQRGRLKKRFDVALLGFGGRVRTVIEFKKLEAGLLELFRQDLQDKYVLPLVANFGVLTNGVDFILYARTNGQLVGQLQFKLSEVTESQSQEAYNWLRKTTVDLESLESVQGLLKFNRQQPLLISDPDSEPARIFFQVFQLRPESAFGRLIFALKEVLPETARNSAFTRGSYEFWHKTFARDLTFKDVPLSWRPFLASKASTEIGQFSFALETGYTIVSRLLLAKAADDRRFPGVRFVPRIQESLSELSTRGRITPENYLEVTQRSFERASETLFASIFLQDIFDWWFECTRAESRLLFHALAECLVVVTQFDFADLSGDLLGELYQRYFDRDTRKALGEFYTPPEIIEFILDECGYRGDRGHRLLDPACGSGSFLVAALRRYLSQQGRSNPKQLLLDLTEGLRIIGFDINPFAVLMSQVNYAALILPLYAEAIFEDPNFRLPRLPVFRTDSLRIEEREEEPGRRPRETLQVNLRFEEGILNLSIYLPIRGERKRFLKMFVSVPRYHDARQQNLVANLEEYVAAVARVFHAARDKRHSLEFLLKARFGDRGAKLHAYLLPTLHTLEKTIDELRGKYDDGRFLKTIEDLVLAVSLKHDLQYDFVVGNPPYVRIQKIPEHVKEYWTGKYEWAEHNYDLYIPFVERAVRSAGREGWLGKNGRLGLILSDRFLNVDYGTKLREELPESLRIDLLLDLRDTRVFADALNYPAVLIGERHSNGRTGDFEAARVFASEVSSTALLGGFQHLRKREESKKAARDTALEVFAYPRRRLSGVGWWLMPADERRIFDKLGNTPGKRLIELSATASGGFAGFQTSSDNIFVFDEAEDLAEHLKVWPRHEKKSCGCGERPLEIEKGALRPFLFGKDVARWCIDWKRSWVLFPYDRYRKRQTLFDHEEIVEDWNLIPCKGNLDEFEFADPKKVSTIEERFPKTWHYLRKHEDELRAREDDRYKRDGTESHLWYGATYPRSLDYYFRPKLVVQLLSRRNSFALDERGFFVFQAGGKGGGVYGVALGEDVPDSQALLAFLNSAVCDFLIKQTSSVYGGRFYSYADQFLKDLPVSLELLKSKSEVRRRVSPISKELSVATEKRFSLLRKLQEFPSSFASELSHCELDTIEHLCSSHPRAAQVAVKVEAISIETRLYGHAVRYDSQQPFEFSHKEHAQCLAEALRRHHRRSIALQEVLHWRLPVKPEGCQQLLSLLGETRQELRRIEQQIASLEGELNDHVYKLYRVQPSEREIIESFLGRYSSRAAVVVSEGDEAEQE